MSDIAQIRAERADAEKFVALAKREGYLHPKLFSLMLDSYIKILEKGSGSRG